MSLLKLSPNNLKDVIKAEAHRLGFLIAGVTVCQKPPHWPVYQNWLAKGYHAGMAYLAREDTLQKKAQPGLLLPGARSIWCFGFPYPAASQAGAFDMGLEKFGRIASYAQGRDYHLVFPGRLNELVRIIEEIVGRPVLSGLYTDSGPLLERDLAVLAGLGWVGKNGCLIRAGAGSYFLLAEMLIDLEFEPDPPVMYDRCGVCRRCIDACPTGCILPDRTLDAGRCISYLTIENKGGIPREMRPLIGDWVFGCDICQSVCPWNKFAAIETAPDFQKRAAYQVLSLRKILSLSPLTFKELFVDSPIARAKRRGLLRNAAVAAGNTLAEDCVTILRDLLLGDSEPLIRGHAAWALSRFGTPDCRQILEKSRRLESDPAVLEEINLAL
jgi:epoxyqueuosine reductase